ncbi:L,D-transpeptidase family protein [Deltaproteobacteria bacterium OttesenSCG-928-M10]|nr:L,D-transpeptidase family protein [Deltaproteobacteria bacterium OttesenSCG-928-M10]
MLTFLFCLTAGQALAQSGGELPDAIIYPGNKPGHILVVDKADQMLYLYRHDDGGNVELDRVMRCSTGINKGDKMVEGDKKTPNGFYIFNQKLLPRELSPIYGTLAYPSDYPNFWDKKLGRGGYGIWIHGINKPLVNYDSNGCVELENADIAQMEELINLYDTPMITYEKLVLAPAEDLRKEGLAVREFIESWREAWVNKDHAAYRDKYDPEFVNSDGRSFSGWMAHKEGVAKNYKTITVEVKDLRIFRHRDVLVAVFEQDYRGDARFTSIGLKRLYIKNTEGGYKIAGEEFRAMPDTDHRKWLTAEEKRKALETPPLALAQADNAALSTAAAAGSSEQAANEAGQTPLLPAVPAEEDISVAEEARLEDEARARDEDIEREIAAARKAEAEARERRARAEENERERAEEAARQAALKAEAEERERVEAAERAAAEARARAKAEEDELKKQLIGLVEAWAEAWRARDIPAYFAFYHPDFYYKAKKMNLAEFKDYRSGLIENSSSIELKLASLEVRINGDSARVIFRQDYRSDNVRDFGRKTLTFKKSADGWKIAAETWRPL